MRILDRQRYWSFFKAYVICYISLVGLFIIIDAFSNMDEFAKRADGLDMLRIMGRYYLVHQSQFFDYLSGVIGMMAAIFTVTWMQRNNEQLAVLAAGISTSRAIRPVLFASLVVSAIAVGNQELVMPYFAEELARRHDDDGQQVQVNVTSRYDARRIMIHGKQADRATRTIFPFYATIGAWVMGEPRDIKAQQATFIPADDRQAPLRGGWLVRGATINPPLDEEALRRSSELLLRVDDEEGFPPALTIRPRSDSPIVASPEHAPVSRRTPLTPHSEIAYLASLPPLPLVFNPGVYRLQALLDRRVEFGGGTYFLKSSSTFQEMTRKSNWHQFATTKDLLESLAEPTTEGSEAIELAMLLHVRLLRPLLGLALLFMSLPLVLGGYGRNMFINLGFALGNSALFYGTLIFTQYLGSFEVIEPPMAAWGPLIGFGTIATIRWGQIRT